MSVYSYSKILERAKTCQTNVKEEYKTGISSWWSYYMAKQIINPKKDVTVITIADAPNPEGTAISNQIYKKDYTNMCKRLINYVEKNKRMPNYITVGNYKIIPRLFTEILSRILIYYDKNGALPNYANANSKVFTKPTEYPNKVYGLWVKYIKTKPKCIDDVCDYIKNHFNYQFYYDDQKSNEQVLKTKSGNCTDLLQMLTNMAEAMDYDWQVIHTKCRKSGTGHVYGKFKKKGTNSWFIRDIACIADESRYCVWCNVDTGGGYLLAKNPSWFIQNRNR